MARWPLPPPLAPARCRQELFAFGEVHDMARGLGGDVRIAEAYLIPLSVCYPV